MATARPFALSNHNELFTNTEILPINSLLRVTFHFGRGSGRETRCTCNAGQDADHNYPRRSWFRIS